MRTAPACHWAVFGETLGSSDYKTAGGNWLMARQGCALDEGEIQKIVNLLASTDMSLPDIAQRTGCSRGAIAAINRRFRVREYAGRRSQWAVASAFRSAEDNV